MLCAHAVAAHWIPRVQTSHFYGALPQNIKNEWNKWKNHFFKMKGDVSHDKGREQQDAYTKTESYS